MDGQTCPNVLLEYEVRLDIEVHKSWNVQHSQRMKSLVTEFCVRKNLFQGLSSYRQTDYWIRSQFKNIVTTHSINPKKYSEFLAFFLVDNNLLP